MPGAPPARFNMAEYAIGRAARFSPGKAALAVVSDAGTNRAAETWSYSEVEEAVLGIAGGLAAADLERGDRLLIRLGDTSLYPLVFFGAIAGGFVPVPASPQLTARETRLLIDDSGAAAVALSEELPLEAPSSTRVLCAGEIARMARRAPSATYADTVASDPAFLVYTSGTSGQPKGVLHAHRSAWGRRPMYDGWYGIRPGDRVLHAGAMNWTYTLGTGLTDPWANGATAIVYTGEKEPALWPRLINQTEATLFAAVPGLYRRILKYAAPGPRRLPSLRHGLIAGETPPPDLFEVWRQRMGTELYEAFGMSEISTFVSSSPGVLRKPGAIGKPQPGRRVAILGRDGGADPLPAGEEGVLAVRRNDPGLMLGYWRLPEDTASAYRGDWFIGGDLASMDEEGYVTHEGRIDDVMNALGYRVAPQEVEAVLARHPDVAEVACAEVHARRDVAVIGAFIVPRDGATPDAGSIKAFAAARLAGYKCPRQIVFVPALPRTPNGKVKRRALGPNRDSAG